MLEQHPGDIKLVHKNYPLRNHKFAVNAAKAALASHRQGKFWAFHEKLMEHYKELDDAKVLEIATELGLDPAQFQKDIRDPGIQRLIVRDIQEGRRAGVRGIPAVFINGKRLKNRSLQSFERAVQSTLSKRSAK